MVIFNIFQIQKTSPKLPLLNGKNLQKKIVIPRFAVVVITGYQVKS